MITPLDRTRLPNPMLETLAPRLFVASLVLCACQGPTRRSPIESDAALAPAADRSGPASDRVGSSGHSDEARRAIGAVLDDWHLAASQADGARYFGHMDAEAVFLGTDATERWTLPTFRAFCEPYFAKGSGWTYECRERHVFVQGPVAWFDELLWNDKYGQCRGTGVLEQRGETWRIVHYSLSLPVPNERAADVVKLIRGR